MKMNDHSRGVDEPTLNEITDPDLILSANRALLCEIRANMRRIYVQYLKNEKKIILHFFYDTPPTQDALDSDVEGIILTEMSCDFAGDIEWDTKSIVLPYPERIPNVGICVFCRHEPTPPWAMDE